MMLKDRALADLRAERAALLADFEAWQRRASATGDLKQHHSQVERVTGCLRQVLELALSSTILGDPSISEDLEALEQPRLAVGAVHAIWDFFRDKLAQRDTKRYADHLGAADDLAWECYLPFLEQRVAAARTEEEEKAIRAKVKEPPLVAYCPEQGLFAQSRQDAFRPPGLTAMDVQNFSAALQRLPVPVITLPWSQAGRAQRLSFVVHEAGHVVADDLELNDEMKAKVQSLALSGDPKRWLEWLPEVFADLFGTAALGSAYVDALATFLATAESEVLSEQVLPGRKYPTRALRVALCCAALKEMNLASYTLWDDAYEPPTPDNYVADCALIAKALLSGSFQALNDKSIRDILAWSAKDETNSDLIATLLPRNIAPAFKASVRTWIAGAAKAQRQDPAVYAKAEVDRKALESIVRQRGAGVRAGRTRALRRESTDTPGLGDSAASREIAALMGLVTRAEEEQP
ncbi:MAG TPA: hypothetical protein VJV79_06515 [Polyangiaceae bacterium]|nr:hypothetical protein [Polyangiaceae bacterium]